jgi:ATP-dependent Clp protease protease subunit
MIQKLKQDEDNLFPIPPDPFNELSYECYKGLLDNRIILLNGIVKDDIIERVGIPLLKMSEKKTVPIQVWINSQGGSLESGQGIVDIMQAIPNPVITLAFGQAMSASFDIFLAGDYRVIHANTLLMCHSGSAVLGVQTLPQINQEAELHKKLFERWAKFYASKTKIVEKDWLDLMKSGLNRYFLAEEALKEGIAHEIRVPLGKKLKNLTKFKNRIIK